MIRPPGWDGAAFTEASDGDMRRDRQARAGVSARLGIEPEWCQLHQVHGARVRRVDTPGDAGEADAMWTTEPGLPLAIFTADCFGVVLTAAGAVGTAHGGWRGVAAGVVSRLRSEMSAAGHPPEWAAIGPGIGPCCFEVGAEVADEFPGHVASTAWGTTSVDLPGALAAQLRGVTMWWSEQCTVHDGGFHSHRGSGTGDRQAAIGWLG